MATPEAVFTAQLPHCLASLSPEELGPLWQGLLRGHQRGKVRESFRLPGGRRLIVATDRLSAFDRILGTVPFKGQVLTELSTFWFQHSAAPSHFLQQVDPVAMLVKDCRPLPVEFIMRGYLTGVTGTSIWTAYQRGERSYCGHQLPEGMRKNEPLPTPILTPTTKGEGTTHDEPLSLREVEQRGLVGPQWLAQAEALCTALFAQGQAHAQSQGLILADSKYELGLWTDPHSGKELLLLIDEVHTPDSSRYFVAQDYEERLQRGEDSRSLDKEYVRQYMKGLGYQGEGPPPPLPEAVRVEAAARYATVYQQLTGQPFVPQPGAALPRLQRLPQRLSMHKESGG